MVVLLAGETGRDAATETQRERARERVPQKEKETKGKTEMDAKEEQGWRGHAGNGTVEMQHGRLPNGAPRTQDVLSSPPIDGKCSVRKPFCPCARCMSV